MGNKPASSIYSMVEKAYFRQQAGDVLTRCLEDGSSEPIHEMIQEMVVAGPQSLDALREILAETNKRKTQVYDDLNQVINQFAIILKGNGINLEARGGNQVLQDIDEEQLLRIMDDEQIEDSQVRRECIQVLKDSRELMATLVSKIHLLESIEVYLQDWLWGLTYQQLKQGDDGAIENPPGKELL